MHQKHVCTIFRWLTHLLIRRITPCSTYFFTDSFLISHPPFMMIVFSRCWSLCLLIFLPFLLAFSAGAEVSRVLQLSWGSHKRDCKMENKKAVSTYQNQFLPRYGIFHYIWIYIPYGMQNFSFFHAVFAKMDGKSNTFSGIWDLGGIEVKDVGSKNLTTGWCFF